MSFITWLKGFLSEEKKEEVKKLNLDALPEFIQAESTKLENKQEEIKKAIKEKIESYIQKLKEQIVIIKNVDLSKRKEEQKIKLIVQENVKGYLVYLEKFIRELENIKASDLMGYIIKINSVINNFSKLSRNSFEKATILVGEELSSTREMIKSLSQEISKIISESPELNRIQKISEIKCSLEIIESLEKISKNISESIENKNLDKIDNEEISSKANEEISSLKKSPEYRELEKLNQGRQKNLEKLKQEAYDIKEKIDLKLLMNLFHSDEIKKKLIESYQDNFLKALEEDTNLSLAEMIKTAKPELNINIEEFRNRKKDLDKKIKSKIEQELEGREKEISKLGEQINNIVKQIKEHEKKISRLKEKKQEITNNLKSQAMSIGIKVL